VFPYKDEYDTLFYITLEALIEFCQGPCINNQNAIINRDSDIFGHIVALLIRSKWDQSLFRSSLKFLFALKESRDTFDFLKDDINDEIFKKFLSKISFGFHSKLDGSTEVGHDFYILCHLLARHNQSFRESILQFKMSQRSHKRAIEFYENNTAQIEIVKASGSLEEIVFPVPQVCTRLKQADKMKIFQSCERDGQGSKIADFFEKSSTLFEQLTWEKGISRFNLILTLAKNKSTYSAATFTLMLMINLLIALFYPYDCEHSSITWKENISFTLVMSILPVYIRSPSKPEINLSIFFVFIAICYASTLQSMIEILGMSAIAMKGLEIVSTLFYTGIKGMLQSRELHLQLIYLVTAVAGTFWNPLLLSILVSSHFS
jgi:inositol 1,4,5-triphosphate receptor type 1